MPGTEPRDQAFAERIEAVLRHRGWSLNEWGRRAGIGKGPMSRLRTRGPANATTETMIKVADAARVELRWLSDGTGPSGLPSDSEGRRSLAAKLAEEAGVQRAAIHAILALPLSPEDAQRPTIWWVDQIREIALERLRSQPMVGVANEEPSKTCEPTSSRERPKRRPA